MSEMAKQARAAMKAKAKGLTAASSSTDPHQKVDSSTWTPPEPLNTEAKTGLRPVSRRAFKVGGKVTGAKAKANMGKKPRASGGKAITADSFVNRNVKEANEKRPGDKHVGGMKKGGRAHKANGGSDEIANKINEYEAESANAKADKAKPVPTPPTGRPASPPSQERSKYDIKSPYKKGGKVAEKCGGGRTHKDYGGPLGGAAKQMAMAEQQAGVPSALMNFTGVKKGSLSPMRASGLKTGGKAKHDDVAADKALIRKMVKPSARTGKKEGGGFSAEDKKLMDRASPALIGRAVDDKLRQARLENLMDTSDTYAAKYTEPHDNPKLLYPGAGLKKGGRAKHKDGGKVFDGPSYPGKVPGAVGGRTAHAAGGKAGKGKTNVNIVIAAGKPAGAGDMMPPTGPVPPPGMGKPPGGVPVPVPPAGGAPAGGMPMGIPMPMPAPAAAPQAGPPMARKHGGRLTKVARSYKDMEAGAGSGEGRLQKTDIAKRTMHNKGGKVGHRNYRSYKDMDAGAASGLGRLEKSEIARKGTGIQQA